MAEERTVLEHLLEGRDALQREVTRLNAAIEQLDAVVDRLGSMGISGVLMNGPDDGVPGEPVSAAAGGEPSNASREPTASNVSSAVTSPAVVRSARAPRKAPAKRATRPRQQQSEAPKSIRVHVLEMLSADNREFGLAEIIESVHDAGIQAHDDAVRSITIKLMKDGRVERVGRGQYRLARRGGSRAATASRAAEPVAPATAAGPDMFESQTDAPPASEETPPPPAETDANTDTDTDTAETLADETLTAETVDEAADESGDATGTSAQDESPAADEPETRESGGYTPPLNLGQPWG